MDGAVDEQRAEMWTVIANGILMFHEHSIGILVDLVEGDDDSHSTVQIQQPKQGEHLGQTNAIFWRRL